MEIYHTRKCLLWIMEAHVGFHKVSSALVNIKKILNAKWR
jgi:hypothetical protein